MNQFINPFNEEFQTRNFLQKKSHDQVDDINNQPFFWRHQNSRPDVFCKKGVLKSLAIFIEEDLCRSFFFNKVARKRLRHRRFLMNFTKFSRTSILQNIGEQLLLERHSQFMFGIPTDGYGLPICTDQIFHRFVSFLNKYAQKCS